MLFEHEDTKESNNSVHPECCPNILAKLSSKRPHILFEHKIVSFSYMCLGGSMCWLRNDVSMYVFEHVSSISFFKSLAVNSFSVMSGLVFLA